MNVDRIIAFYETKYDRIIDEENTRTRNNGWANEYHRTYEGANEREWTYVSE